MVIKGWLIEEDPRYRLSAEGAAALPMLGVGGAEGRMCMDWSERRPHLAGPLGRRLAEVFLEHEWLRRETNTRALWVTAAGREAVEAKFAVAIPDNC